MQHDWAGPHSRCVRGCIQGSTELGTLEVAHEHAQLARSAFLITFEPLCEATMSLQWGSWLSSGAVSHDKTRQRQCVLRDSALAVTSFPISYREEFNSAREESHKGGSNNTHQPLLKLVLHTTLEDSKYPHTFSPGCQNKALKWSWGGLALRQQNPGPLPPPHISHDSERGTFKMKRWQC